MTKAEFPQPLPRLSELELQKDNLKWDFPFGNSYSRENLKGPLQYIYVECETFTEAIKPQYRIIMGRKGSGKTALIKRICLGNEYDRKIICKQHKLMNWVNNSIGDERAEQMPIEAYQDECIYFYWRLIFEELAKEKEPQLKAVRGFLNDLKGSEASILDGIREWSQVNLQARNIIASLSAGVITTFVRMNQTTFEKAKDEATEYLKDTRVVILIDNLEEYSLENPHQRNIFAGLLLSSVTFEDPSNIVVKCFIPSEYSRQLMAYSVNWGKLNQHITELRWKDRELLTMLCSRLGFYLYMKYKTRKYYQDLSKFVDINKALAFWKQYFTHKVYNEQFRVEEPIVPYILRHTQLTPRQAIQLCNEIVKQAEDIFPNQSIPDRVVRKGIEICEKELCQEVFSSFSKTYPNAGDFCTENLRRLPMSFSLEELHTEIYGKIDIRNDKYERYKNDYMFLERMLFDLGIVGIGMPSDLPDTDRYNLSKFEPNNDEVLSPNPTTNLFVHPMFNQRINFIRNLDVCSKPVCPIRAVETPEILSLE